MLRIAKNAVVLIEPNDHTFLSMYQMGVHKLKTVIKHILKLEKYHPDTTKFETSGNYIYTISRREVEKIALGLNLRCVAVSYYNDYYEAGFEFKKTEGNEFERVKKIIKKIDLKSRLGLTEYGGIRAIIFKTEPTSTERKKLTENGFQFIDLPINRYQNIQHKH